MKNLIEELTINYNLIIKTGNEELTKNVTLDRENFGYYDIFYDNYNLNI